jgi:hypothetical protein
VEFTEEKTVSFGGNRQTSALHLSQISFQAVGRPVPSGYLTTTPNGFIFILPSGVRFPSPGTAIVTVASQCCALAAETAARHERGKYPALCAWHNNGNAFVRDVHVADL